MNKKLVILFLVFFIVGMTMGSVAASHTFKAGKYKGTISDKKYNSLKKKAKQGKAVIYSFKTKQYKIYKEPKYKTKKVTTKKWKYKKVVSGDERWSRDWSDYTTKDYNTYDKYSKKGWTWYGSYYKTYDNGHHVKHYDKFKKKVKVTTKKKVKVGYKKVKKPVYICIGSVDITGKVIDKNIGILDVYTDYGRLDV